MEGDGLFSVLFSTAILGDTEGKTCAKLVKNQ
jgi:hypothetical protein